MGPGDFFLKIPTNNFITVIILFKNDHICFWGVFIIGVHIHRPLPLVIGVKGCN